MQLANVGGKEDEAPGLAQGGATIRFLPDLSPAQAAEEPRGRI